MIYYPKIHGTELMAMLSTAWAELVDKGFIDEFSKPIDYEQEAFAAPLLKGFITFSQHHKYLEIGIGYVKPEYRGENVYEDLYKKLRFEAKSRKCRAILSNVFAGNDNILAHAERMGREIRCYNLIDRLP